MLMSSQLSEYGWGLLANSKCPFCWMCTPRLLNPKILWRRLVVEAYFLGGVSKKKFLGIPDHVLSYALRMECNAGKYLCGSVDDLLDILR